MIGVVLWSDSADKKAVIWCEDQGDLAFLGAPEGDIDQMGFFDVGDVVKFDVALDRNLRRAENAELVSEGARPELTMALGTRASTAVVETRSAEIIPFRMDSALRTSAPVLQAKSGT